MGKWATKINMYNVYHNGSKLIGMNEEVKLPDFEPMTGTIAGPGIAGEIDEPIIGLFGSAEVEIPFSSMHDEIISIMNPGSAVDLTLRASTQIRDNSGNATFEGVRIVLRGLFKGLTSGSLKQGEGTKSSVKFEVTYVMYEVNGVNKLEIDKWNQVYKVNGYDCLSKARSLC